MNANSCETCGTDVESYERFCEKHKTEYVFDSAYRAVDLFKYCPVCYWRDTDRKNVIDHIDQSHTDQEIQDALGMENEEGFSE